MDGKLKILVVDDDNLIRKLVIAYLRDGPYEFIEAEDGDAALRTALKELPDVVITDLMLPKMDGAGLIAALRGTKDFATAPIVAITAGTDELQLQAKLAGANIVLTKPLSEAETASRIESLIAATPFLRRK